MMGHELAHHGTTLGRVPDEISGTWTGEAADASIPEMHAVAGFLRAYGPKLQAVHDALVSLASDYEQAQSDVAGLNRGWEQANSDYDDAVQQASKDYDKAYDGAKGADGRPPNRAILDDLETSRGNATSTAAAARDKAQGHLTGEFEATRQHLVKRTQHCGGVISAHLPVKVSPVCGPDGRPPIDDRRMMLALPLAGTYRLKDAEEAAGEEEGGEEEESAFMETFDTLKVTLFDMRDWQATIFGGIGYANFYEKGAGSIWEQGRAWEESEDGWRGTQEALEGKNWEEIMRGGMTDEEITSGMAKTAGVVGKVGRVLGPLGVAGGVFLTGHDIVEGHTGRAAYDGITTLIGGAALFSPPPADLVLGGVAGVMTGAELLYDHVPAVKHVVDGAVNDVKDVASDASHAVSHAFSSIF
jgi:hypothetical protein